MTINICIVGAGAMGTLFGALLTEGGCTVTLLDNDPERARLVTQGGLRLEGVSGDRVVKLNAETDPAKLPQADVVLIATKAYDTAEAVKSVAGFVKAPVLTLQNGLGNVEAIAEIVGTENVLGGTTCHGASVVAHGHTRHAGTGPTVIGAPGGAATPSVKKIVEAFNAAGIPAETTDDLDGIIWGKIVVNSGINPLGAVLKVRNGEISACEESASLMERAASEAAAVAEALGIKLPFDDPAARVRAVAESTASNINSMLADVLVGKRTEIDAINGQVVEIGKRLDVPTPINEALLLSVKAIEKTFEVRVKT